MCGNFRPDHGRGIDAIFTDRSEKLADNAVMGSWRPDGRNRSAAENGKLHAPYNIMGTAIGRTQSRVGKPPIKHDSPGRGLIPDCISQK